MVIGPDEYHELVNDNAYTNVMARWNLRAGARRRGPRRDSAEEADRWRELADGLVDGYDAATGRLRAVRRVFRAGAPAGRAVRRAARGCRPAHGPGRVSGSQIIKQPDVLMLHHLVPSQVQPGSLEPNLDFYGPRTAHGSSLSPAVTAALLARAGRADEALAMLGLALTLDMDDLTGMTAAGLHMANLAGVWQAMLSGFAGVAVHAGVLTIDPRLPAAWGSLQIRFRCLGRQVRLDITHDRRVVRRPAEGPPGWRGAAAGVGDRALGRPTCPRRRT